MGLSLRNIGRKIGDVLGGVERQVNPFDNGATYSNPNPPPPQRTAAPNAPPPGILGNNSPVQLGGMFRPPPPTQQPQSSSSAVVMPKRSALPAPATLHPAANTGPLINNAPNTGAPLTNNSPVQLGTVPVNNPNSLVNKPGLPYQTPGFVNTVARPLLRTIPEALLSLNPTQQTYQPGPGVQQALFGKTPVQNIEKKTINNLQTHQNLPRGARAALATGEAVSSLAADLPVVGGLLRGAKVAIKGAPEVVSAIKPAISGATRVVEGAPKVELKTPSVVPAPPSPEGSVGAAVKDVSAPVKELANKVTVLKQIGTPSSQELAQRVTNIDSVTQDLRGSYRNAVPTALSLSDKEFRNFGRAVETGTKPINSKVAQAVKEHQALFPEIHGNYAATGASVGKLPNYFPRDYSGMKPGTDGYNQALQGLVDSGKAKTTGEAVKLLDILKKRGESAPGFFGSFDKSRVGSDYTSYTKSAYEKYLNGAARKTAEAQQLGPSGEVGNQLIGQISQEGGDHILAQQTLKNYLHDAGAGRGKALSTVRGIFGVARLGKASISHMGQTTNVGLVTRLSDLGAGWAKRFGSEGQRFIKESDVNNPENLHGLVDQATTVHGVMSKGTAPLLKQMMMVNRGVSAIAGRRYGNFLAAKGNETELRSLGVTGDIGSALTREQELQAARGVTNKTMFTPSRAQTPLHAETPVGKTVGQYRLAYAYKQMGLLYDSVIKEAARGNLAPLGKFAALSAPVAGGTIAVKNKISGNKEGPGGMAIDTLGALGGIPGELAVQAARYGAKYPVSTAASAIAPLAGEAVNIAQDAKQAIQGHPKQAERYAIKLVPVVGSRLARQLIPTSPAASNYAQTASDAGKSLAGDTKASAAFKDFLARSKDPTNGKTIQNSPAESIQNALALSTNDKLRATVQKFEKAQINDKGKSSFAPSWNLPPDQLKIYEQYKSMYTGDANKNFIFQQNPWIKDAEAQDQAFYATLPPGKGSEKNPQTPTYPKFDAFTQGLLDRYNAGTPAEKSALLQSNGAQISQAWGQKADWTNAMRRAEGAPELKGYPVADAATQQIMKTFNALPKGNGPKGGSPNRAAWIKANPGLYAKMQDYMSQAAMSSLVKNASLDQFQGATADQALLKDIKNLGTYDIATTKNADGTTSYSLNPSAATAAYGNSSTGGSKFSSSFNNADRRAYKDAKALRHTNKIARVGTKIKRPSVKVSKGSRSVKFKGPAKVATTSKVALKPSKV